MNAGLAGYSRILYVSDGPAPNALGHTRALAESSDAAFKVFDILVFLILIKAKMREEKN